MVIQHVTYALRLLRRSPAFTTMAVLTFGLAIGATTAVFSHVRATILAPLPYPDPDRLISVWPSGGALARSAVSPPMYDAIHERRDLFAAVGAVSTQSQNLTGGGEPERVSVARVTESMQAAIGMPVAIGRWFLPEEDAPTRNAVAVLSQGLWQRRFGGDRSLVGRTILLNAVPHVVVGVMGDDTAAYPARVDLWVPIAFTAEQRALANRGSEYLDVIARVRPDVSAEQVRTSLDGLGQRLRALYGITVRWTLRSARLDDDLRGDLKPVVLAIFGAVLLVFVVACANIANLMLARAGDRHRELAIRLAVGAAPGHVRAQSLVEAATLAVMGGSVGVLLAWWLSPLLAQAASRAGLPLAAAPIDGLVLAFGLFVTIASALLAGALPAWQATRVPLAQILGRGGRGSSGTRLRPALVAAEIALAFIVVVSAALLMKSLARVTAVDPGFGVDRRLTLRLTLPAARYATRPLRQAFHARLFDELGAVSGVERAAGVSELPLSTQRNMASFDVERRVVPPGEEGPHADMRSATPSYFAAMAIGLVRGRTFEDRDRADSTPVAVIDETVARRVFGSEDPIGQRVALGIDPDNYWREIVGIVGSVHHDSLEAASRGTVYVPLAQRPTTSVFVVLKTTQDPAAVVPSVRAAIARLDADLPVYDVATLQMRLRESFGRREITAALVGTFAGLALVLALTGVYGVIAHAVIQRTREIGVRMALGAQRRQVLWLFIRTSALTAVAGVAIGAALAVPLMRVASTLLFGVTPHDPAIYWWSGVGVVLLTAAISAVSARRATSIDPLVALRQP